MAEGQYTLNVDDVPATARGGAVLLGGDAAAAIVSVTEALRGGQRTFVLNLDPKSVLPPPRVDNPATRGDIIPPAPTEPTASSTPAVNPSLLLPIGSAAPPRTAGTTTSSTSAAFGASPIHQEHLGGGDTTMTPAETLEADPAAPWRDLAEQFRLLINRWFGAAAASRTEAPVKENPQGVDVSESVDLEAPVVGSERSAVPSPRTDNVPFVTDRATVGHEDRVDFLSLTPLIATRALEIRPRGRRKRKCAASIR
jgi:hypothetical protein